jgi:hypothetical protein
MRHFDVSHDDEIRLRPMPRARSRIETADGGVTRAAWER